MDSFYSNAIEFFVEHGVKLNKNQIEKLKEDALEGYLHRHGFDNNRTTRNNGLGRAIRFIQVAKNRCDRGEISKQEFNKVIEKQRKIVKEYYKNHKDTGFNNKEYNIRNKKYAYKNAISNQGFNANIQSNKYLRDRENKIKYYLDILRSTDNVGEYKSNFKALAKLTGLDPTKPISVADDLDDKNRSIDVHNTYIHDKKINFDPSNNYYHTSKYSDLNNISPKLRSQDHVLYPDLTLYGTINKPLDRAGNKVEDDNTYIYKMNVPKNSNIKSDEELYNNSIKIQTKHPIAAKRIK